MRKTPVASLCELINRIAKRLNCIFPFTATALGKGVYFAVASWYSAQPKYSTPDASGRKRMYQARVLTGEHTKGSSSYRVPPSNAATPGFPFDSVVDNVSMPQRFVIFLDNQAYPEYLITFTWGLEIEKTMVHRFLCDIVNCNTPYIITTILVIIDTFDFFIQYHEI